MKKSEKQPQVYKKTTNGLLFRTKNNLSSLLPVIRPCYNKITPQNQTGLKMSCTADTIENRKER